MRYRGSLCRDGRFLRRDDAFAAKISPPRQCLTDGFFAATTSSPRRTISSPRRTVSSPRRWLHRDRRCLVYQGAVRRLCVQVRTSAPHFEATSDAFLDKEMLRECDDAGRCEKARRKIATARGRNGQLLENARFAVFLIFEMLLECGDVGRFE